MQGTRHIFHLAQSPDLDFNRCFHKFYCETILKYHCSLHNFCTPKTKHTYNSTNCWSEYAMFGFFKIKYALYGFIEEFPIQHNFFSLQILLCKHQQYYAALFSFTFCRKLYYPLLGKHAFSVVASYMFCLLLV